MKKSFLCFLMLLGVTVCADLIMSSDGKRVDRCSNKSITTAVIPEGTEVIGGSAFYNCTSLVQVTIPPSVKQIERDAFFGCSNLTLRIPATVTEITEGAFRGMRRVYIDPDNPRYYSTRQGAVIDRQEMVLLFVPQETIGIYRIMPEIKKIGSYAFYNCAGLQRVILPSGVKEIGCGAFQNCLSLESIYLNKGLEVIDGWAFYSCENLRRIVIPASVKTIGESAFASVPQVILSAGSRRFRQTAEGALIEPGRKRFIYCPTGVETCVIPEDIQLIGDHAFAYCTSLKRIRIPAGVRVIGRFAFYGCESLEKLNIPAGVREIGRYAFMYCNNLERVTIRGATVVSNGAFCDGCRETRLTRAYVSRRARIHREAFPDVCEIIRCDFDE